MNSIEASGTFSENGSLPPAREAIVEQGNRIHQEVAHQRDELLRTVHERDQTIALYKVSLEGKDAVINSLDSRMNSAILDRDQAVADAAQYKAQLMTIAALVRTLDIPAAPHIREIEEPAIGGA